MTQDLTKIGNRGVFDPFQAMDALDDTAILAELEGQVIDKWVYHFPQEGRELWGLSKVGVDQACREMALRGEVIREENIHYELDPTDKRYILFKAAASRIAVNRSGGEVCLDRTMGTKRQCVFVITSKEGVTNRPNEFWFEQGSIKALRNARLRLLSEEVRSKIIALAKEKGKVTKLEKPRAEQPEATTSTPTKSVLEALPGESDIITQAEKKTGFTKSWGFIESLKEFGLTSDDLKRYPDVMALFNKKDFQGAYDLLVELVGREKNLNN